jgi:DNA-binding MarR family transcriptional regulator
LPATGRPISEVDVTALAVRLDFSMRRLRSRVRAESGADGTGWTRPQLTALYRVVNEGPITTSELAAAEYMRPQSMAQTVAELEKGGLVERSPDPTDGRKVLIAGSKHGVELVDGVLAHHGRWLRQAILDELDEEEQQALAIAVELVNRLADSAVVLGGRGTRGCLRD